MNKTPATAHVTLLGSFQIKIDERTLSVLDTDRATALLAYLLVENQPQRRERLAALFWPEMTEKRARANLSQAIYALRKHLEFDENLALFHSDTRTIQLNPNYPISSDIGLLRQAFCGCVLHQPHLNEECAQCLTALHQQLGLLRGEFLDGLSLPACADFEAWLREQRQLFLQKSTTLCRKVALWLLRTGESEQAGAVIQRWISLDPFDEEAQLINLRLLLQNGQRNAAVLAFENYRRLLQSELESEPSAQLNQLYAQIQAGTTPAIPQSLHLHALNPNSPSSALNFVGRSGELAQLQSQLASALAGNGQISFVTGEAGFGKSALLQAFARQTAQQFPQMITLLGNCNAYTGLGDPYLPIRELLSLLAGDVETQQRAGAISSEQAAHLRNVAPSAIRGLVELAPDLVGTLLIPSRLLMLATTLLADQTRLEDVRKLVAQKERERAYANAHGNNNGRTQSALFEQMTKLLQHLATQQPLLLLLDDLHWADMGTIALLFHLSRNLQQSRVLIVGTFRPSEVMAAHNSSGQVGPSAGHHPLEAIYHELQRQFGKIEIALEEADGQSFVNDLLDRQVNRLDQIFRQRLYQYTHGNALFTTELLKDMQQQGQLVYRADGYWEADATLKWENLPVRIEGVIAQRIARLPEDLREALIIASIEGESFHAEVVATVQDVPQRQMIRWLSSELDRQHGIVTLQAIETGRDQPITHYRFHHILFQKYLYQQLDAAERSYLHAAVGSALETLYQGQTEALESIASELARHFEAAGQWLKAAEYFLIASRRALRLAVPDTAITQATNGAEVLEKLPLTTESMTVGLGLQICLGIGYTLRHGYESPAAMSAYERAASLYTEVGDTDELVALLAGLAATYRINARLHQSAEIGRRIVALVEQKQNLKLSILAYGTLGATLVNMGRLEEARSYLELSEDNNDFSESSVVAHMQATDPKVVALGYLAYALVPLGFIDRARTLTEQAQALADKLAHPNTQAFSLFFSILVELMRRDLPSALRLLERLRMLAKEQESINFWIRWTDPVVGWISHEQGDLVKSLALLRNWLPLRRTQGETHSPLTWQFAALCMALIKSGEIAEGLETIVATLQLAERIDERWWEAELHRLHGELLLCRQGMILDPTGEAEKSFRRAIECAQQQNSKWWELRATTSLARLLQKQGRTLEAHTKLAAIYAWFTEGFDSNDMQEAEKLIQVLKV